MTNTDRVHRPCRICGVGSQPGSVEADRGTCGLHWVSSGAGRREPGEDFSYAVEDDSEYAYEDEWI